MDGEFTNACARYYRLIQLFNQQAKNFGRLAANALPYTGQTCLTELDDIIRCNREIQEAKAEAEQTATKMREAESIVLNIMEYFEILPRTKLTGEIPGELEFEIWADENNALYISKTKDLVPPVDDANIIRIKISPIGMNSTTPKRR